MKKCGVCALCLIVLPAFGETTDLDQAISNARISCNGISDYLATMKTKAGINTAITGVGTVAGGGALGTGLSKNKLDTEIENLEIQIEKLKKERTEKAAQYVQIKDMAEFNKQLDDFVESYSLLEQSEEELNENVEKSLKLGNWRTGLLATNTATNVAGAIVAGTNKAEDALEIKVKNCISVVETLATVRFQARLKGNADEGLLDTAQRIINSCSQWQEVDLSKITDRAKGATISSGIGAGVGLAGTITSASANSNKIRNDNSISGKQKEKNLNTAANVLAGGAAGASGVATIFNATQISAVKKVSEIATKCEEALK